jgi:hypothetical protein
MANAPAACWNACAAVLIPSGVARSAARPSWDQLAPRLKITAAFSKCTFAMDTLLCVLNASAQENETSMWPDCLLMGNRDSTTHSAR